MPVHRRIAAVLVDAELDTRTLVHFDTPLWLSAIEWCAWHHLDSRRIPAGSMIVRSVADRRITTRYLQMEGDKPVIRDKEFVTAIHIEQGEAPPLPFPREDALPWRPTP